MDRSLCPVDRKLEATAGKHWAAVPDVEDLGAAPPPTMLEPAVLALVTFTGSLNESVRWSGKEDQAIADEIHISPGYMSRAMRGIWQGWAKRLVAFMRATNSVAPLQWLAREVGAEVVLFSTRDARIRALEAELRELNPRRRLA